MGPDPDMIRDDETPSARPATRTPASQQWSNYAFGLALVCLAALALSHGLGFATPLLSGILMIGIVISGTAAWAIQARQPCPHCGALYGYRFRVTNTHLCPTCGADLRG